MDLSNFPQISRVEHPSSLAGRACSSILTCSLQAHSISSGTWPPKHPVLAVSVGHEDEEGVQSSHRLLDNAQRSQHHGWAGTERDPAAALAQITRFCWSRVPVLTVTMTLVWGTECAGGGKGMPVLSLGSSVSTSSLRRLWGPAMEGQNAGGPPERWLEGQRQPDVPVSSQAAGSGRGGRAGPRHPDPGEGAKYLDLEKCG